MGRKLGRVEKRDIREEMRFDLLPRAFTALCAHNVWIDRNAGLLLVDSGSPTRARSGCHAAALPRRH